MFSFLRLLSIFVGSITVQHVSA